MGEQGQRIGYVPALDGLRAVAVAAVLLFHAGFGWAQGGFLGVSVFFTLSGFLITSLLLAEHEATGAISLHAFFGRRLRRLVPASYACLLLVVACSRWWNAVQRRDLPGDVVAAALDVANWRFAFAGTSYQDLFLGAPSPLAHFWSLAIEEQCYVVLPLVAWWCLRRGLRTFTTVVAALFALAIVATLLTSDADLVYYGTHTRAAELLAGVLLAVALRHRRVPQRWSTAVGVGGSAVLVAAIATTGISDGWLYHGGLAAMSLASVAIVVGLTGSPALAAVLSVRPLVATGKVSYGLYLYHWPIFLLLSASRTGLAIWPLFALRVAATAAVSVASYRWLEQPIRHRRVLVAPRPAMAAMGATMGLVLAAGLLAVPAPQFTATETLLAQGEADVIEFAAPTEPAAPVHANDLSLTTVAVVPRVLVVGSRPEPVIALRELGYDVVDGVQPGCPVANAVQARLRDGTVIDTAGCEPAAQRWPRLAAGATPALVVVALGATDSGVVRTADEVGFPGPGDIAEEGRRMASADEQLRSAVDALIELHVPLVLFDAVPADATFDSGLDTLALSEGLGAVHRDLPAMVDAVRAQLDAGTGPAASGPMPVLVIGDSTSLDVAQAINDGSDGALQVTWAGANGCPFVRATATRPSAAEPWRTLDCEPFDEKLPPLLDRLRPELVLLVAGPMELVEQRYGADPAAHVAGDPGFVEFHDREMQALVDLLRAHGVPLMVGDSPSLTAGGWASEEMAAPERLAAWNAQVASWAQLGPDVTVLPLAQVIGDYELAHGSIRTDGVHPDIGPLTELAREQLVTRILAVRNPGN